MNLAQTANRLTKIALAEPKSSPAELSTVPMSLLPNIEKAMAHSAFNRIKTALSLIAFVSSKGAYKTTISRAFDDKIDEMVRDALEAVSFKVDIDTCPGVIVINWE